MASKENCVIQDLTRKENVQINLNFSQKTKTGLQRSSSIAQRTTTLLNFPKLIHKQGES